MAVPHLAFYCSLECGLCWFPKRVIADGARCASLLLHQRPACCYVLPYASSSPPPGYSIPDGHASPLPCHGFPPHPLLIFSPSPWGLPAPASSLQALVVRHTMPLCPPWRCTAHGASPAAHQHAHTTSIWAHLGACTPRTPPHAMARPGCNWPAPGGKKLCSRASFPLSSSSQPGASFLPVARYPETHACRACPPVSCCARASA